MMMMMMMMMMIIIISAALGPRSYFEEYVGEKVENWVGQVIKLAEFTASRPQASSAAYFNMRLF